MALTDAVTRAANATGATSAAGAPPEAALVLEALERLDEAAALLDPADGRVLATTGAWRRRLPSALPGSRWCGAPDGAPGAGEVAARAEALAGGAFAFDTRVLTDGRRLVRARPSAPDPADGVREALDLRRYLQARDSLFSTSRTISVSEMATTLAHELNQPIGTITNLLGGLKRRLARGQPDAATIGDALDRALEQARFTQSVIARIRDFTQARRPEQRTLDVRTLVADSVALLDWLFSSGDCEVSLELPDEPLLVRGDATMLQQVLINLLRNAVDASREQPRERRRVVIGARLDEELVALAVRDAGHGLSGREDSLFVPFATGKSDGMGVGLNICRSFVELHQGRLWLAPNEAGGATAWVELPRVEEGER